jgi:hypothetical protein
MRIHSVIKISLADKVQTLTEAGIDSVLIWKEAKSTLLCCCFGLGLPLRIEQRNELVAWPRDTHCHAEGFARDFSYR